MRLGLFLYAVWHLVLLLCVKMCQLEMILYKSLQSNSPTPLTCFPSFWNGLWRTAEGLCHLSHLHIHRHHRGKNLVLDLWFSGPPIHLYEWDALVPSTEEHKNKPIRPHQRGTKSCWMVEWDWISRKTFWFGHAEYQYAQLHFFYFANGSWKQQLPGREEEAGTLSLQEWTEKKRKSQATSKSQTGAYSRF